MNCLILAVTAAILNFQTSNTPELVGRGEEVSELLQAQLTAFDGLTLVERTELGTLLGEQGLGLSGTITTDSAAQIGKLTGAKILVTGRVFQAGQQYFLVAKIMSAETGRVFGETTQFNNLAALGSASNELAGKVAKVISSREKDLIAGVSDRSERISTLKKLLAGKILPTISVAVVEQHLPRPVIDPAAQTQMQKLFQELGFEVIDPSTSKKAATIAITGEAFSEMGMRHSGLVSCRARVEIKVTNSVNGTLLLADSEAQPGVDISEAVAAKKALEEAAFHLTERVIPKVVQP